jgi:hypothetical protein
MPGPLNWPDKFRIVRQTLRNGVSQYRHGRRIRPALPQGLLQRNRRGNTPFTDRFRILKAGNQFRRHLQNLL